MISFNVKIFVLLQLFGLWLSCIPVHGQEIAPSFDNQLYLQGAKLYEVNCKKCHRDLSRSERKGAKLKDLEYALTAEPEMMDLWGKFKDREIQALAMALNSPFQAALLPPRTKADQYYKEKNPKLYEWARKYFPADAGELPAKRIFRLTRQQLEAEVKQLLPKVKVSGVATYIPKDPLQTNYEFAESLTLGPGNLKGLAGWYNGMLAEIRSNPQSVIVCSSPNYTESCLSQNAQELIQKFFRGDERKNLSQRIIQFYLKSVGILGFGPATADLVEVLLNSPQFLFRAETEVDANGRLKDSQLLSSLTFTLGDSSPQGLGLDIQQAEKFTKDRKAISELVYQVLSTQQSREKLVRFFKAWLEVKDPSEFRISTAKFPEFNAEFSKKATQEVDQFLRQKLYQSSTSLKEIIPLLTLPAVIASHSGPDSTRLIKRGVFWVRKLMCMELAPPPPNIDTNIPPLKSGTERQRVLNATSSKTCQSCHKVINPFGFALERYDTLGRVRDMENGQKIDTSITIDFLDEGPIQAKNTEEALKVLTDSAMFKQCFVRQLFRFYTGRTEEESDHPLLRALFYEFLRDDQQDVLHLVQSLGNSNRLIYRGGK